MSTNTQKENSHAGHRARLKQRFLESGLEGFNDHQILELLLFFTLPQKDTNEIAHELINRFGSLSGVFNAHPAELEKVKGISAHSSTLISMIRELSGAYLRDLTREKPVLNGVKEAEEYIKNFFMGRIYEVFYLVCMDNSCRVIHTEKVCEGTLDETPCYPRLIVEVALRHNAQKVIFAHNHPSNVELSKLRPSTADIETTKNLVSIFKGLDIDVVDHIIVGRAGCISMAEIGCLK